MSGAIQMQEVEENAWQATGTDGAPNLKQVAAERLAAHRHRRATMAQQEAELEARTRQHRDAARQAKREDVRRGASVVRDAVVARYERRESYREFLAAEAERAIAQAQAEADVAARSARAVAEAQMALLEEFDQINRPEPGPREAAMAQQRAETRGELAHALADIVLGARELIDERSSLSVVEAPGPELVPAPAAAQPAVREVSASGLTVRLFEDMPAALPRASEVRPRRGSEHVQEFVGFYDEDATQALSALEEEIDFRRAPEFPITSIVEPLPIPGNLIEFPRELVAPRRARPRLAEGPLQDEPGAEPQLRIFEVDAMQAEDEPLHFDPAPMPVWQSLHLEATVEEHTAPPAEAQAEITLPPQVAPIERRLMAAAVDSCCVGAGWLGALAVVAEIAGPALRSLSLPLAGASAFVSLATFTMLYQMLFFSLSDGTPGMLYARIGLCTFGDGNPSRRAMRRRVFSTLLAACPLGLGLAWTLMDNDNLGWHDRMSRMYQRAY